MRYVLHRDKVVATKSGHAIQFTKGELVHVPPEAEQEVIAVGAVPESEIPEDEKASKPLTAEERKALILMAIGDMVKKNDPADFTAGGQPHAAKLSAVLGFNVDSKERDTLWDEFRQKKE